MAKNELGLKKQCDIQEEDDTPNTKQEVTVFNVNSEKADDFINTLPLEAYDKVVKSHTIQVNQVDLKDVPTATRRITNLADYRALAKDDCC